MSVLTRKVVWGLLASAAITNGAVAQQPASKLSPIKTIVPQTSPQATQRSVDPLGTMLAEAKTAYGAIRDYTCVFTKQERIKGVLSGEQVAEMKVRIKPYSVAIRYARPAAIAGMEMNYMSSSKLGKMLYRPAGAKGLNGAQYVALDDPKILAENRHPITQLGVGALIDRLGLVVSREGSMRNPVEVYTADYQFAGRNVTRYEIFTRRPHLYRYAYLIVVCVDKETKLPVRIEAYDAPRSGQTTGELIEAHSYSNLKLNVGLGDSAFNR